MVTQLFRVSPEIFLEPTLHTSFKIIVSPVAPIKEQTAGLLRATKNVVVSIEKRLAFHLRVLHLWFQTTQYSSWFNKKSSSFYNWTLEKWNYLSS